MNKNPNNDNPYSAYVSLNIIRHLDGAHQGLVEVVMDGRHNNASGLSSANASMHAELAHIWHTIDHDPLCKVALIRGEGKGFSAGGDLGLVESMATDFAVRTRVWKEAKDLVYNIINCSKPVVSAMHGPAVGAGLVAGLLADISIAANTAKIVDGHTRLGVAAGDHAAIVWPLLCGMAKAKYYLMLCESLSGLEAERIGLVSLTVDETDLLPKAYEVCDKLLAGSQTALQWTKYSLNNWLRQAGPSFDASLALEFIGFAGPDLHEGVASLREKRAPQFKS